MRIFLGAFLNPSNQEFYDRLTRHLVAHRSAVLRAIPAASAHVTYVFIPEVTEDGLGPLLSAIAEVAGRCRPFDVQLGRPMVLQARGRPRLVCADFVRGAEQVGRLTSELASVLGAAVPDLRPSQSPHVTLARFHRRATRRDAADVAESLLRVEGRTDQIRQIQVVESILTPTGPVYAAKRELRLGERES